MATCSSWLPNTSARSTGFIASSWCSYSKIVFAYPSIVSALIRVAPNVSAP